MELQVLSQVPERAPSSGYLAGAGNTSFPELLNKRLVDAAKGNEVDSVPVWVMRQAGRYLPEFRELRQNHDFFEMCTTPSLACEITLQPVRRFPLDAAIIFSDILVVPQAMGMKVEMVPGKGPVFPSPLSQLEDFAALKRPDLSSDYEPYFDSIYLTRHSLKGKVPLIGFAGGPFTLFTYMVEGSGSSTFTKARRWLFENPETSHSLLSMLSEVITDFVWGQICSGAQYIQIFESHAGYLGGKDFEDYLLKYVTQIASTLKSRMKQFPDFEVPLTIFAKGAGYALEQLCKTEFDVVGIDWTVNLEEARALADTYGKTLQGNLDPALLYASPETISERTREMYSKLGKKRYICNLGHGIYPDVDPSHLGVFIETIHQVSS